MDVTKIRKGNTTYNISPNGAAAAQAAAETAAAQANAAAVAAQNTVTATHKLVGGYLVPLFDASKAYVKNNLVFYRDGDEGHVYRCTQNRAAGPWGVPTENSFVETSLYQEIVDMRGENAAMENVIVRLHTDMVASGQTAPDLSGKAVTLTINGGGAQYTVNTDANGEANFGSFAHGTHYTISVGTAVTGYALPRTVTHNANMSTRYIDMYYRLQHTGWYVIDKNSPQHIDIADWDTANNDDAVLLGYQNSKFRFAIKIKNRNQANKMWQTAQVLLTDNDKYVASSSSATFLTDAYLQDVVYEGAQYSRMEFNTMMLRQLASNYTPTAQVVPAADYCYGDANAGDGNDYSGNTVTIGGTTYHGCLPLLAMLDLFVNHSGGTDGTQFMNKMNEHLSYLGGNTLNIRSGYFWSSEQNSSSNAWYLSNGTLTSNGGYKTTAIFAALPFFDL